jgi:two-component system NarL family response regulator/two-component system response regulator DevR
MESDPGRPRPVRVVLVDADDRVRESLCGLLCIGDRIDVVGSAGHTETALDVVLETRPDIVVLDPRLPDVDGGLSFIDRLRADSPGVRVVVLCGADHDERADLEAAADGCVRKTFRPGDLVAGVVASMPLAG